MIFKRKAKYTLWQIGRDDPSCRICIKKILLILGISGKGQLWYSRFLRIIGRTSLKIPQQAFSCLVPICDSTMLHMRRLLCRNINGFHLGIMYFGGSLGKLINKGGKKRKKRNGLDNLDKMLYGSPPPRLRMFSPSHTSLLPQAPSFLPPKRVKEGAQGTRSPFLYFEGRKKKGTICPLPGESLRTNWPIFPSFS